jgi:uncharacterized protein
MLVKFSVKNFRSFRDEQVLSLEAGRQATGKMGRTFDSGIRAIPRLLRGAVIYGANSGGKTNFIRAMDFFRDFVVDSAKGSPSDKIDVDSYRLDRKSRDNPSQFEIVFVVNDTVFQYGFSVDRVRVHAEWLFETPAEGRIRHIFNREYSEDQKEYDWYINPRLKGEKKLWQDSTRQNALFLSTSVQLNSKDLSVPFEWINEKFRVLLGTHFTSEQYTAHVCHAHDQKTSVLDMLQSVDVGVCDIDIVEREFDEKSIPKDMPDELRSEVLKRLKRQTVYSTDLLRKSSDGSLVKFDLDDESTGTNILFSLAGPWLDTLCNGYTLVIDELDSGLHPLALKALINMFFDPRENTSNAQLIITCHEATLLQEEMLRPDQVWFIDKTEAHGSRLYPLSEFKPRQSESYLRGYLGGRYGGIPLARSTH